MRRKAGTGLTTYEKTLLTNLATDRTRWVTFADLNQNDPKQGRRPNEATIYRVLHRFAEKGWLDAKWTVPADVWEKTRPTRVVRLTAAGRRAAATEAKAAEAATKP